MKCIRCNDRDSYAKSLCNRCYYATKGGFKTYPEMIKERNYIKDGVGVLSDKKGDKWFVDIEDFEILKDMIWSYSHGGYLRHKGKHLHKFICPQFKVVDHIDRDTHNNRRGNLRDGGKGINALNKVTTSASGYKAVHKMRDKYQARPMRQMLGTFDTAEEAHKKVIEWAETKGLEEFYKI